MPTSSRYYSKRSGCGKTVSAHDASVGRSCKGRARMTTDATQQLLDKLRSTVNSLSAAGNDSAAPTSDTVHGWALQVLQDGFQGSSSLPHVWSVVSAMGRAHPLLLSKDIQAAAERARDNSRAALHAWVIMALQSGSFSTFLRSLPTQPQVVCAYAATAPVRQRAFCTQAAELLLAAQGAICEYFLQQEQQQQQQVAQEPGSDTAVHDDTDVGAPNPDANQHSSSADDGAVVPHKAGEEGNETRDAIPSSAAASAGQEELTTIEDSRSDTAQAVAVMDSSADVSSQSSELSRPMLHIETEEDALARREAAAGVRAMPRFWPPVHRGMASEIRAGTTQPRAMASETRAGSTQDSTDAPGGGAALAGQQQAVAKAAAAGWQGALLALDYAKQGVGQAKFNWAWPKVPAQASPATAAGFENRDKLAADTTPATSSTSTGKHSWMLPGRWRQLSRPASQSGSEGMAEGTLVRVHLSVQHHLDDQQQQQQAGQPTAHVQVRLEVCHDVPSGAEAGRGGADQRCAKNNAATAKGQRQQPVPKLAEAEGQLPLDLGEAAAGDAAGTVVGSTGTATVGKTTDAAASGAEGSHTDVASIGTTAAAGAASCAPDSTGTEAAANGAGGYGIASWMRGTAVTATAGAATAAGVLAQVQWRNAAASMFSAVATATNAVAARRTGKAVAVAGITSTEPSNETLGRPAEVQPTSHSGTTSVQNGVASSLQPVDGGEECDMLEDMREVLQGGGGLTVEQHHSRVQLANLPSNRSATMLHTESLPVLHSSAAVSASSQNQLQLPVGHRRTVSAQPSQAAEVAHIVLHPPTLQAEVRQETNIAAKARTSQQGGSFEVGHSLKQTDAQVQQLQHEEVANVMVTGHHQRVDEYGEQYTTYELEVQSEQGNTWKVHRRFSEFVTLKKALVALHQNQNQQQQQQQQQQQTCHPSSPPGKDNQDSNSKAGSSMGSPTGAVTLPVAWDQVSQSRGVLGRARMSADVIHSREALISKCMSQLLAANPPPRPAALQQLLIKFLKPHYGIRTRPHSESGVSSSSVLPPDLRLQVPQTSTRSAAYPAGLLQSTAPASSSSLGSQHALHSSRNSNESLSMSQGSLCRSDPGSGRLLAAMASARTAQAAEQVNHPLGSAAPGEQGPPVRQDKGTTAVAGTSQDSVATDQGHGSELSMTVRLIVDPLPNVSESELERRQGGKCAGCKGPLPATSTAGRSGWLLSTSSPGGMTGPLRCWYTNKLYCSTCHAGSTQFIPAAVIHSWDFTARPVCIAAADYLRAVRNQPVLCVPAVNPGLYARVPALADAAQLRRRVAGYLQAADSAGGVLAQRAAQIRSSAGLRGYLLVPELLDWWALSDLLDLSLGAFAKMPAWLDKVARQAGALAAAGTPSHSNTAGASANPVVI